MKTFNTYINEKLKINKQTVSNNLDSFDEFLVRLQAYIDKQGMLEFRYSLANSVGDDLYFETDYQGIIYFLKYITFKDNEEFITLKGQTMSGKRYVDLVCRSSEDLLKVFKTKDNIEDFYNFIYKNLDLMS
jgi:hypothetical protein